MTATTLNKIDKAFDELTAGQLDGKLIPKSKYQDLVQGATRNLGGHQVLDKDELARRAVAHINKIVAYANARAKFIKDLDGHGITPLATLPLAAWNTICKETKLLKFRPSNGVVYFDAKKCRTDHEIKVRKLVAASIISTIILILATALASAVFSYSTPQDIIWSFIARAVAPTVAYIVFECNVWFYYRLWTKAIVRRKLRSYEGIFTYINSVADGTSTSLLLPTAPADVQAIMLKVPAGEDIYVAAVADAVAFMPGLNSLYSEHSDQAIKDEWAERARLRAETARDPINYLIRDGVVAIIAQYGEFPVEQALIDRLVKEEVVEMPY